MDPTLRLSRIAAALDALEHQRCELLAERAHLLADPSWQHTAAGWEGPPPAVPPGWPPAGTAGPPAGTGGPPAWTAGTPAGTDGPPPWTAGTPAGTGGPPAWAGPPYRAAAEAEAAPVTAQTVLLVLGGLLL